MLITGELMISLAAVEVVMADPVFTPAVVGTAVNMFVNEVINAAKGAYRHREKCRLLLESANKLQPHIDGACEHSAGWEKAQSDALHEIKGIMEEARSFGTRGVEESKREGRKRAVLFWRWGKLPAELAAIIRRIEKAMGIVVFCAAVECLKGANAAKKARWPDFVVQPIPAEIVGVDVPFNKLKAAILESHTKDAASHLGLHGRGGAGKTLVAKMLHNDGDIKGKYGADLVRWISVGLDARVRDVYKTMATFLGDARFEQSYIHRSLEDQRSFLMDAFREKKVLLVLDDVWQEGGEQNHAMMYWLNIITAPGSVTLITTRNVVVLSEVYAEAEVVLSLSEDDSWKLFCIHAFDKGTLPETVPKDLAKEVCEECGRLPLALEVVGSTMRDKVKKEEWSYALHGLKQSKAILGSKVDSEVFGRLRWSYDMLEGDVLKTCFLYFAAFPEDYEIEVSKLVQMWISEGLVGAEDEGKAHLAVLEKRSLIDLRRGGTHAQVHDILRGLALMIIAKAEVGQSGYNSFFASGKVLKSLPPGKSVEAIKRMSLINNGIPQGLDTLRAANLQVCLFSGLNGSVDEVLSFFSNLRMTNLKYLDLSHTNLNFQGEFLHFCELRFLTHLDLSWCKSLRQLPKQIGEMKALTNLYLNGCSSLQQLPEQIGEMKALANLYLNGCLSLQQLPVQIGELKALTNLDLDGCSSLQQLPAQIGELKALTDLVLYGCSSLQQLPKQIGELKALTNLDLNRCSSLQQLPEQIGELKALTLLDLFGCSSLQQLLEQIGELKAVTYFNFYGCSSLLQLPEQIGELKALAKLYLNGRSSLQQLPEQIGELKALMYLDLYGCSSLQQLPEQIGRLKALT